MPGDTMAIFKMRSSQRVNRFIARNEMEAPEAALALVEKTNLAFENKQAIGWAGQIKGTDEIIGTCGFNNIDYDNLRAEIGGEMDVCYWGQKLAQEAVSAILDFGFEKMNLHAIEAKLFADNRSAIYVLQQFGFKKEAHFKDRIYFDQRFFDMVVFTLHKD